MCRKIVEHHGGSIWLEDTPPPGSTFVVALPVVTDRPVADPETPAVPSAPGHQEEAHV
jgi:K+-sensing histidine kinase KdpD